MSLTHQSQQMGSDSESDDILGAIDLFTSEPKDDKSSEFICEVSGQVVPEGEQAKQGRMGFKKLSQIAYNASMFLPWKLSGMP